MSELAFIVLARVLHILAGVAWAGATVVMARVIVPLVVAQDRPSPWFAAAGRVGRMAAGSAVVTVLSGIYLFAALHRHDSSAGGMVLGAGALAALLSISFSVWTGHTARTQLAHITGESGDAPRTAAARRRLLLSSRAAAGLLILSVLAMALFRYASALG